MVTSNPMVSKRPKSAYRALTDAGQEFGVSITSLDRTRIAALGRWYCLPAESLARLEVGVEHWNPAWTGLGHAEGGALFAKQVEAIKRRFAKLARVQGAGTNMGPLVGSHLIEGRRSGWFVTRYGASAAELPWPGKPAINPFLASHAWMAADVGMQIEALGYRVLSERELGSKIDQNDHTIETRIDSTIIGLTGQTVSKKPDVAVIAPDGRRFLAIEVERSRGRPLSTYTEKLRAYDDNPAVGRVWYLCASDSIADRVGAAADKVFGTRKYPLRIRVVPATGGWQGVNGLERDDRLMGDLAEFQ